MDIDFKGEVLREPIMCTLIAIPLAMVPCAVVLCLLAQNVAIIFSLLGFMAPLLMSIFFVVPFILTVYNLIYLLHPAPSEQIRNAGRRIERVTVVLGVIYSYLWVVITLSPIKFAVDWYEESFHLYTTPLSKETFPTIAVCIAVAVAGYCVLRFVRYRPIPVTILCFGAMYMGIVLCAVWIFQVIDADKLLCLAPFNFILIAVKVMKEEIWLRRTLNAEREDVQFWEKGIHWLWIAAAVAVLLFAAVMLIMLPFGQPSDSLFRAWTDTRGFPLSRRIK